MFASALLSKLTIAVVALSSMPSASAMPFGNNGRSGGPGASGGPAPSGTTNFASSLGTKCDVSSATPSLPADQTTLTVPSGTAFMVALGVGVQNYTCASTGTYSSTGAVADLFDATCFVDQSFFSTMTSTAFTAWNASTSVTTQDVIAQFSSDPAVFGQHYFIEFNSALSPTFDARAGEDAGNSTAFVVMSKAASLTAPTGSQDVPWLQLTTQGSGDLAQNALRIATQAGQAPTNCTVGSADISVKYTAQYWLYE